MSIELSTQNSCHKVKLFISTSTKPSCDVWCAQWERKEENCGKQGHGCFIMTMFQLIMPWELRSFLPKITMLHWSNHPTLRIWPLVTSLCFPNTRKPLKELVSKIQKPVKQPWRKSFERSRSNPCGSAWKHGRGDLKSTFEPKEITLKATCKIYLSNKIKHLLSQSRYFSITPRICFNWCFKSYWIRSSAKHCLRSAKNVVFFLFFVFGRHAYRTIIGWL